MVQLPLAVASLQGHRGSKELNGSLAFLEAVHLSHVLQDATSLPLELQDVLEPLDVCGCHGGFCEPCLHRTKRQIARLIEHFEPQN